MTLAIDSLTFNQLDNMTLSFLDMLLLSPTARHLAGDDLTQIHEQSDVDALTVALIEMRL